MLANQQSFENGFTIWPNPVIDTFQIEWPTNVNSFCLTLYNQLGQLIKKKIPLTIQLCLMAQISIKVFTFLK